MIRNNFLCEIQRLENLAWATAQVHCYCTSTTDEKLNDAATKPSAIQTADTSLHTQQGQGNVVLETEPKILFCDLRLSPGEIKSCKNPLNAYPKKNKFQTIFSSCHRFIQRNTPNDWTTYVSWYKYSIFL